MSKPTTPPIAWAADANYAAGVETWSGTQTKTAPLAGKIAIGFEPKERPSARYWNYLFYQIYLWIAYLVAGVWTDGVEAAGFRVTYHAPIVIGNAYVIGDRVTCANNVYECITAGTPTGLLSGTSADITNSTSHWKYISFYGYHHGDEVFNFSPVDAANEMTNTGAVGFFADVDTGRVQTGVSAQLTMGLSPLQSGLRIKSITFELLGDGVTDLVVVMKLRAFGSASMTTLGTSTINNTTGASWTPYTINITDHVIADGDYISLQFATTAFSSLMAIGTVQVTCDRVSG